MAAPVGVSYDSDSEQVRRVLLGVADNHPDILAEPLPVVLFSGFGDSSLDFELLVWTETRIQTPRFLQSELNFRIFEAFRKNSIEIPFPQTDLHIRSSDISLWEPREQRTIRPNEASS
ncbi:mechanosensitive ion channel family protein [Chlorobaculum thiosulfatiphilum]|uniref:mechanosensitive ion channel family protein n=1 Tax=Chlorobaculum thiosulfatiphilum TaxID=115852 RepID=UPI0026CD64DC